MLKVLLAIIIVTGVMVMPVYAQSTSEFGYQLHPEMLLENTIGNLQIYTVSNEIMVPKTIEDLKVISSDTEIIEILEIENTSESSTRNLKIQALSPGIVTISLAAPGFSSKEITLEVFNNNNHPTQLMMKATPNEFSVDGQSFGYLAIQLATTGGLPTIAEQDTHIEIQTPNSDVIKIKDSDVTIKEGEYFVMTEFEVVGSGDAIIFADTEGMRKISEIVTILEAEGPLEIQLTIIPDTFNSFSGAKGYAIVQLLDVQGIPVAAEEDIHLKLGVENPDISVNTSHDFDEVLFDHKTLVIKKGEYSTYTKFSPRPNLSDFTSENQQIFQMFVSVQNYLASGDTFTILHDEIGTLEGEGPAVVQTVPFLTTGNEEIIGVAYFETAIEVSRNVVNTNVREIVTVTVPVMAKSNFELNISSSDSSTVKTKNSIMKKGENSILILGDAGTMVPEEGNVELYITDNDGVKTVEAEPNGPQSDTIELQFESMIPMILAGNEFPFVAYLVESVDDEEGETSSGGDDEEDADPRIGPTKFVEDGILTFSANDLVDVNAIPIKMNQEYAVSSQLFEDVGETTLDGRIGEYQGTISLTSHTTDPAITHMGFIDNMLVNQKSLATIQFLDTVGNPVYAKEEIIVELVSNDESILKIPDRVIIKEGEYFSTFELEPLSEGVIEVAILTENLPLSKYEISIIDINPVLTLDLGGQLNWNERIEAKLSVKIPEIETSLAGYSIEWEIEGGEIKSMDDVTNNDGIAISNIIANEKETVSITAKISGNGLSETTISEIANIKNMPIVEEDIENGVQVTNENSVEMPIDITMIILIAIPAGIVGAILFLKKTDRLELLTDKIELLTDKIPMGDKMEEIKEKISDIRNR